MKYEKKILHIIPYEKFTLPYIEFVNRNFDNESHIFIVYNAPQSLREMEIANCVYSNSTSTIRDYIKKSDGIILHSLSISNLLLPIITTNLRRKKLYWVVWGADLYSYRNRMNSLKEYMMIQFKRIIVSKIDGIISLVPGDADLVSKWYDVECDRFKGAYVNLIDINMMEKNIPNDNVINIQLGNSADKSNQHIQALEYLTKYKNNDIKIYAPLSYGNKQYAREVIDYGSRLFGKKFIPMLNFLEPEKYAKHLSKMDCMLFNNDRQQALFNIYGALYLNKKVFMKSGTTMWNYIRSDLGFNIFDIDAIKSMDFDEFIERNDLRNSKRAEYLFSETYLINIWKDIFLSI